MTLTVIELYRRRAYLIIRQLSAMAEYVPNALSQIEHGHRRPWPRLRTKLAEVLNVSESVLFSEDGWPKRVEIEALLKAVKDHQHKEVSLSPFDGDVVCNWVNGVVMTNIPHRIVQHSPDGFEWDYSGSGPAEFALNILSVFVGSEKAQEGGLYQEFKRDFIAKLPKEGGTIKREDIFGLASKTWSVKSELKGGSCSPGSSGTDRGGGVLLSIT